jgi:hypothetical protein
MSGRGHLLRAGCRRALRVALPAVVVAGSFAVSIGEAHALSCLYQGAASGGSWHLAGNWSCGQVPGSGDAVAIPNNNVVSVAAPASAGSLAFGGAGSEVRFADEATLTTGSLTVDAGKVGGTGTLVVSGAFTKGSINANDTFEVRDFVDLVLDGPSSFQGGGICVETLNGSEDDDSTLQINDTFTIESDDDPNVFSCSTTGARVHVGPDGHLVKAVEGSSNSWTAIDNDGTITVQTGTFYLLGGSGNAGGATSDGAYLADDGATLEFQGGSPPLIGSTARLGGEGTISVNTLGMDLAAGATLDPQVFRLWGSLFLHGSAPVDLPVFHLAGTLNSTRPVTAHAMHVTSGQLHNDFTLTVPADGSFAKTTGGTFYVSAASGGPSADLVLDGDATHDGGLICVARQDGSHPDLPNLHVNGEYVIGAAAPAAVLTCGGSLQHSLHVNGPDGHLSRVGSGSTFVNDADVAGGTVSVADGQTFVIQNVYEQSAGVTEVAEGGVLQAFPTLTGGVLRGGGQITGNLTNNAGTVAPGAAHSLGVTGHYTQGAAATLEVDVAGTAPGTGFDQLAVGGAATLGGTVAVVPGAGFDPQLTDEFPFLTSTSRTGTFAALTGGALPSGKTYALDYPGAPGFGARLLVQPAPPSDDVIVVDCDAPELETITTITGDLVVDDVPGCVDLALPNLTEVGGSVIVTNNSAAENIDLSPLASVGGDMTVVDNGSAEVSIEAPNVGGNLTLQSSAGTTGTLDIRLGEVAGTIDLVVNEYGSVTGSTAGGDISLQNTTAEAVMRVLLPEGAFETPVPFSITHIDPALLGPETGTDADGNPATIDPVATYIFGFGVPTLGTDATLTFDVLVDGLDAEIRAAFLSALSKGQATLFTRSDPPENFSQAFPVCTGVDVPTAGGCVRVQQLDANGEPTTGVPAIVRFSGVTGHFSTWGVALVEPIPDTTPPVIDPHADVVAEATGPSGATVIYVAPSANDDRDGAVPVSCVPVSGGVFPLGSTTVECSAEDAAGNPATSSFTVGVVDTTAPVITVPADIVESATGPAGAPVTFMASAIDAVDGLNAADCSPPSGSVFPIDTTAVTCTATDAAGNAATPAGFSVTVVDAGTVPGTPAVSALAGWGAATVSWTEPDDGGSPITGYSIEARVGATTVASAAVGPGARSHTFGGLANGVSHTVTVVATNEAGPGPAGTATAKPFVPRKYRLLDAGVRCPSFTARNPNDFPVAVRWVTSRGLMGDAAVPARSTVALTAAPYKTLLFLFAGNYKLQAAALSFC